MQALIRAVSCAPLAICLATSHVAYPSARLLEVADLVYAKTFQDGGVFAAFSADEKLVASVIVDPSRIVADRNHPGFARTSSTGAQGNIGADIWVGSAMNGDWKNLTKGQGNNWAPSWSPSGRQLAFISDRDGIPNLWLWDRKRGAIRKVSKLAIWSFRGEDTPIWLPDETGVVVVLRSDGLEDAVSRQSPTAPPGVLEQSTVKVEKLPIPRESGQKRRTDSQSGIAVINVERGDSVLLAKRNGISTLKVSPDGASIAFSAAVKDSEWAEAYSLNVLSIDNGTTSVLDDGFPAHGGAFSWSPDSKSIAYVTGIEQPHEAGDEYFLRRNDIGDLTGRLQVATVASAKSRPFEAPEGIGFSWHYNFYPVWACDGKSVFVQRRAEVWRATIGDTVIRRHAIASRGEIVVLVDQLASCAAQHSRQRAPAMAILRDSADGHQAFAAISKDGSIEQLFDWPGNIGSAYKRPVLSPSGRVLAFIGETASRRPDLWLLDTQNRVARQRTELAPQLAQLSLGNAHVITYTDARGRKKGATLLLPSHAKHATRYPAVVWVYPGSAGSESFGTFGVSEYYNLQILASRGFAILAPDLPVTIGAPLKDIVGNVGRALARAEELGYVDARRLAVMGQSGGANTVLVLVTQTDWFRVGIANAPAALDPISSFAANPTWWTLRAGAMSGAPWAVPDQYLNNSPVFSLDRIRAPLLIQVGEQDTSSVGQSKELYEQLRMLGKTATFLTYAGESHVLEAPANLTDYWRRVVEFLELNVPGLNGSAMTVP
jgi:dipeptidyl aminopeptidase/acylaminoacyl peptidase